MEGNNIGLESKMKWTGLSRYKNPDAKKEEQILVAKSLTLSYIYDVPGKYNTETWLSSKGPITPSMTDDSNYDIIAPQYKMDIVADGMILSYGPWANAHRELIQNFYFPFDYQNRKETVFTVGSARPYSKLLLNFQCSKNCIISIPFRNVSVSLKRRVILTKGR
jgi:hypothetical protein